LRTVAQGGDSSQGRRVAVFARRFESAIDADGELVDAGVVELVAERLRHGDGIDAARRRAAGGVGRGGGDDGPGPEENETNDTGDGGEMACAHAGKTAGVRRSCN
jgi:hypothetical protein